jgi:hypothetical protein
LFRLCHLRTNTAPRRDNQAGENFSRAVAIGLRFATALNTEALQPIADSPSPILRDYSAQSDVLLVSFSGLKRNPEKVPGFSLRGTLAGVPARKLYLRDLNKAWFLRGLNGLTREVEGTAAFLNAEISSAKARRLIFTGYSLGGFAALLYGVLCGVDEIHAISPQAFINFWRRWRAGDHRWQRYVLPLHFSGTRRYHDLRPWLEKIAGKTTAHIYFARDSRLDVIHAQHIRDLPRVAVHERAEGSHRLVTVMRESGELRSIFERAVAGESLRAAPQKG